MTTERDQLALVVGRLEGTLRGMQSEITLFREETRDSHKALQGTVAGLLARETERNGAITNLLRRADSNDERWRVHREWSDARASELRELREEHDIAEAEARGERRVKDRLLAPVRKTVDEAPKLLLAGLMLAAGALGYAIRIVE